MSRKAFTVTNSWGFCYIRIKGIATGNLFDIHYTSQIGADIGDTVSIIFGDNDIWKTIINERTGDSSTVSEVSRVYS